MAGAGVSYDQLRVAFSHGNFESLYFFYGDETFLMTELQELLLDRAIAPNERDFNLDVLYGPEVDVRQVLATCAGFPMMAERRVVIVREFDRLQENRLFAAYAERPNPHAVVVLVCGSKPNLSMHPYRALKQHAVSCEFRRLEARKLPGWIENRVAGLGLEIEPRAVQMLAAVSGAGLATTATEVDKLVTYAGGRATITADDVIHASGQTREYNVFELQRTIGERQYERAVAIAEQLLRQANNPQGEAIRLLFVLGAFFSKLWKLAAARGRGSSETELARVAGVPGYFLKEYLQALRHWGPHDLGNAFSALLAADFELKGGSSREHRLIVMLMIGRMLAPSTSARAA